MDKILEIKDLHVHYFSNRRTVKAVNDLSLDMQRGRVLGLVGETGAGKTTLALSILNMIRAPQGKIISGSIRFNNTDILGMSNQELREMRGKDIAMIFQDPMTALNPVLTIGEQIAETIYKHERYLRLRLGRSPRRCSKLSAYLASEQRNIPTVFRWNETARRNSPFISMQSNASSGGRAYNSPGCHDSGASSRFDAQPYKNEQYIGSIYYPFVRAGCREL